MWLCEPRMALVGALEEQLVGNFVGWRVG